MQITISTLLLLAACFALGHSMPLGTPQRNKQLDISDNSADAPRVKRTAEEALANVTGPKYIKDLYLSDTTSSQANTIRSLKYTQIGMQELAC